MLHRIQLQSVPINPPVLGVALTPSGDLLALTGLANINDYPAIAAINTTSGEVLHRVHAEPDFHSFTGAAFEADGRLITWGLHKAELSQGIIRCNLLEASIEWHPFEQPPAVVRDLQLSADNSLLLLAGSEARVVDMHSGHTLVSIPTQQDIAHMGLVACFGHTFETIWVYGSELSRVVEYSLDGRRTGRHLDAPCRSGSAVVCSPDGTYIAIIGSTGTEIRRLQDGLPVNHYHFQPDGPPYIGHFSKDGRFYTFAGARFSTLDLQANVYQRGARVGGGLVRASAASANADMYAFAMHDGFVVWGTPEPMRKNQAARHHHTA